MSEIKLKPCPFCGGEACTHKWQYADYFFVACRSCGAMVDNYYMPEAEAAEAWNKRAKQRGYWIKKNGIYECSECGVWFPHRSAYCRDCGAKMDGGKINDT